MTVTPSAGSKEAASQERLPLARPIDLIELIARGAFGSRPPGTANRVQEALRRFHQGSASEAALEDFLSDWDSLDDLATDTSALGLKLRPSLRASEVYAAISLLALEQARGRLVWLVANTVTLIDASLDQMLENAIWANAAAHDAAGTEREQRSNVTLSAQREAAQRSADSQKKRESARIKWRTRDEHVRLAVEHSKTLNARSRSAAAVQLVLWLERNHKKSDGTAATYDVDVLTQ